MHETKKEISEGEEDASTSGSDYGENKSKLFLLVKTLYTCLSTSVFLGTKEYFYLFWMDALQFSIKLESGFLNLGNLSFSTVDIWAG